MALKIPKWLTRKIPRNLLLRRPLTGSVCFALFFFSFVIIYRPFSVHPARSLSLGMTMFAYSFANFLAMYLSIVVLQRTRFFSDENDWNLIKEILAVFILLSLSGITLYFAGFIIEVPADRWKFRTFLNSYLIGYLIGIVPFAFFTISNYRFIFFPEVEQFYTGKDKMIKTDTEELINVSSQLKKESLSFYPSQLLYAESDGNYTDFNLIVDGVCTRKTIRNSISNIEQELSHIQGFMRVHRAFIVNLKKVNSKKGNSLGYILKLSDTDAEIPVSRGNTGSFDMNMKHLQ